MCWGFEGTKHRGSFQNVENRVWGRFLNAWKNIHPWCWLISLKTLISDGIVLDFFLAEEEMAENSGAMEPLAARILLEKCLDDGIPFNSFTTGQHSDIYSIIFIAVFNLVGLWGHDIHQKLLNFFFKHSTPVYPFWSIIGKRRPKLWIWTYMG